MPLAPSLKAPARRNLIARLRENAITKACGWLGVFFALPYLRGAKSNQSRPLDSLPQSAQILIIKPCCLGDVVLSTPVIAALRQQYPHAKISYAVSRWSRPVLENNPHLDFILDTGFDGSHFSWREYLALVKKIRQQPFDAALVLDRSPLLALLPWLAGIKIRAGLDSLNRGFALNYKAKIKPGQPRHEAEIYLDVARALGISPQNPQLEFFPSEAAKAKLQQKAEAWKFQLQEPLAVIHPGGGKNPDTTVLAKRWPAHNFGEIAARLLEKNYQVAVIGAKDDQEAVADLIRRAKELAPQHRDKLFNLAEQLDIAETGALFQHAQLFIGNDTGLMHIACACDLAVVAIFGPSSPTMYGPFTAKGRALSPLSANNLPALPLSEYQALSVEQGGIAQVSIAEVWQAIISFL